VDASRPAVSRPKPPRDGGDVNDSYSRAAGKASEFAAGDIESILSDAAPMSDAATVLAASVVRTCVS